MRRRTLKLLPGLRWRGKMHVTRRTENGCYAVEFDAEDSQSTNERYVFDRAVLSARLIEEWTGVNLEEESDAR